MKINQLICPTCGLVCFTDSDYTTCSGCQTHFYASQSRKMVFVQPQPVYVPAPVYVPPVWPTWPPVVIIGDGNVTCAPSTGVHSSSNHVKFNQNATLQLIS